MERKKQEFNKKKRIKWIQEQIVLGLQPSADLQDISNRNILKCSLIPNHCLIFEQWDSENENHNPVFFPSVVWRKKSQQDFLKSKLNKSQWYTILNSVILDGLLYTFEDKGPKNPSLKNKKGFKLWQQAATGAVMCLFNNYRRARGKRGREKRERERVEQMIRHSWTARSALLCCILNAGCRFRATAGTLREEANFWTSTSAG